MRSRANRRGLQRTSTYRTPTAKIHAKKKRTMNSFSRPRMVDSHTNPETMQPLTPFAQASAALSAYCMQRIGCCTFSLTSSAFRALQVFVMTGWYPCVKKALLERGWTQNLDRDSPFFDLKWTLHSQDIRTTDIQPWQLCNHFFKVHTYSYDCPRTPTYMITPAGSLETSFFSVVTMIIVLLLEAYSYFYCKEAE